MPIPNRYIDVKEGRKAVKMQVNAWKAEDGSIHVTCDGEKSFHGYLKPNENLYSHFQRVLEESGRW